MKNRTITTMSVAAAALLALADAASAYYSPRLGRFLNRDPISEPGAVLVRQAARPATAFPPRDPQPEVQGAVRIDAPKPRVLKQFPSRTPSPEPVVVFGVTIARLPESSTARESNPGEQDVDELNLCNYARSSPTLYVDPLGLSTRCGSLSMKCKYKKKKEWPVYGDSERAKFILGGRDGCVTLLMPKAIFCTGSCQAIKGWVSAGNPSVKILDHEACHACAYEDCWLPGYLCSWIPGDLTGHCDRHPIRSTPSW